MDPYRYFIFNQKSTLILGVLQVACAGLCLVCGFMDAIFRKDTPLSTTRTPVWGSVIMACPGLLALLASQRKNSILVIVMVVAAGLSCTASLFISAYSCLTLTYGEEDQEVFHHHNSRELTFVLHKMVKAANATILLSCIISLALSCLIMYMGCRSLPHHFCYNNRIGLEMLVPQSEPRDTELVSTWQGETFRGEPRLTRPGDTVVRCVLCPAGGDIRLFDSPALGREQLNREEEEHRWNRPSYSRLS